MNTKQTVQKLNVTWLVGLFLTLICLAGAIYGLHEYQMRSNAPRFLGEAKRAQAENRPGDAADYLSRYVELAPHDTEGFMLLGFQLADLNNENGAYVTLEKVIQREPARAEVRRRLVELAMKTGRYKDALDHLEYLLLKDAPGETPLLEQKSRCQYLNGDFEGAIGTLQDLIEASPERIENYQLLATIQRDKRSQPELANQTIEQMVATNPENYLAHLACAQWNYNLYGSKLKTGQKKNAESMIQLREVIESNLRQGLELAPEDADAIYIAARILREFGHTQEAAEFAAKGYQLHATDLRFATLLSDLETSTGNLTSAVEILRSSLASSPQNKDLRWQLANTLIDQGGFDESHKLMLQLQEATYPEPLLKYLEGRLKLGQKEWSAAIAVFESVQGRLKNSPDLLKRVYYGMGTAYGASHSRDQQLASYRRALDVDPQWNTARLALAETLVSANQFSEALIEYRRLAADPEAPPSLLYKFSKVVLLNNRLLPPSQRNWSEFEQLLKRIEVSGDYGAQTAILSAEKLKIDGDFSQAAQIIANARGKYAQHAELWTEDIFSALTLRDWSRAEQLIQEYEQQIGDTPELRLIRGRYLVLRGSAETIPQLKQLANPPANWSEPERLNYFANMISLLVTVREFDEAEKLATALIHADPDNLEPHLMMMDIALLAKRPQILDRELDEVYRLVGGGATWHYGQAVRLLVRNPNSINKDELSQALGHLQSAKIERPSWNRIPVLAAEIYERLGQPNEAAKQLLEAIRLGDRTAGIGDRALAYLINERRYADADKLVRQLRDDPTMVTIHLIRTEIELAILFNRKQQALTALEKLAKEPHPQISSAWLGQAFLKLDKFEEAEAQFLLATKSNPADPLPWMGLVQTYAQLKKPDQANTIIEEAKTAIPSSEKKLLAVGQLYEIVGKPEQAREAYQSALEQSPDETLAKQVWIDFLLKTGAISDAETLLRKLLDSLNESENAAPELQQWTQRKLAIALLSLGSRERLSEALRLIDLNLGASEFHSAEDLRVKGLILSRSLIRAQRVQGITLLEKALQQEPGSAAQIEDRLNLVRLYQATGEQTKCLVELRNMIASHPTDVRVLATYIQFCLQTGKISEAELTFASLQKIAPENLDTWDLQAQVLFKKEKYPEVLELLKKVGSQPEPSGEPAAGRTSLALWAARRLADFARSLNASGKTSVAAQFTIDAEFAFSEYVRTNPGEILVLAEFLASTNQIGPALDLLEKNLERAPLDRVASIVKYVLSAPVSTSEQLARLQNLVDAIASNNHSVRLALISADLKSWRGDKTGADRVYQDILAMDDRNVIALNNRAVLLSQSSTDQSEAMRLIQAAIEIAGPVDALIDTRGLIYLAAGQLEKAVTDFEQAAAESEKAEWRFHEAIALAQLKKPNEARKLLDRAKTLGLKDYLLPPHDRKTLSELTAMLQSVTPQ